MEILTKLKCFLAKELVSRDPVLEGWTKREDRITKREETVRDNVIKQKL